MASSARAKQEAMEKLWLESEPAEPEGPADHEAQEEDKDFEEDEELEEIEARYKSDVVQVDFNEYITFVFFSGLMSLSTFCLTL